MRRRDLWLILVAMAGIALGVGLPAVGLLIRPTVLYLMMTILFMSFLKIDLAGLARFGPGDAAAVVLWSGLKLIALPVVLWALARWLLPGYALAVLLLTATSTGVTAPFFAVLLGANTVRVLQLVVVTSLLVPLTLPALVRLLMGAEVAIGFMPMARMLLLIIVVPFALSLATRRWLPALARAIDRVQYPLSLTLFFLINWGVFAAYRGLLVGHGWDLAVAVGVAGVLAGVYCAAGCLAGVLAGRGEDALTGGVMMTYINNVLVIVFASQFFGQHQPEAPLLAAMYLVPFFFVVIPLRWVAGRRGRKTAPPPG